VWSTSVPATARSPGRRQWHALIYDTVRTNAAIHRK
jgi:hypothetical protein